MGILHAKIRLTTVSLSCINSQTISYLTHNQILFFSFRWVFLEVLSFSSFLGIQMVKCESYRLEMCMSFVTCLSISMSCYIVADIDNPFHGFFRIELKSVLTILENLAVCFHEELMTDIKVEHI